MTNWNRQAVPKKNWLVSHELPDTGETVVFDSVKSELVVLNPVGGATWDLLDGNRSILDIAEALRERTDGAPSLDDVVASVVLFLEDMQKRGAVEESRGGG